MQVVYKLFEKEYPTKFGQGCAAHAMNLLIKDIAKLDLISNITNQALIIIKQINYHAKLKSAFDEERKKVRDVRGLQIPVVTRWHSRAYGYLMHGML